MTLSITKIRDSVTKKGYKWFTNPYQLNLVGIRKNTQVPNAFDDLFTASFFDGQQWQYYQWRCTVDPGLYWLQNPGNIKGTAILPPGQYLDTWQIGMHQGKYRALTQAKAIGVWRDVDRDNLLDYDGQLYVGMFGINIHRANPARESTIVDKWSAGCTVIANPNSFAKLMSLVDEAYRLGYRLFSYTLLNERDLV